MGKSIQLGGYFLLGVSCCGLFSYTAYVIPRFQYYAFWLVVVVSLCFVVAGLADDFLAEAMGVDYQSYIGGLIVCIAIVLVGSIIQWIKP
ncbi:MAG: hypothetical protein WBB28_19970 [Crinalium sp.]